MEDMFREMMGNLTDEEYAEVMAKGKKEYAEKMQRKSESKFQCRIPDWTDCGGMVSFWINDNGTFEAERHSDKDIRKGLISLANEPW